MKRIGDKAARVLLTIFGFKTTVIIGTVLTLAIILVTIIAGIMGTVSSSGDKAKKISSQCVTYQKDGDEEDDDEEDDDDVSKPQSTSTKTDSASAGDSDPFTKGTKAYENAHKVFMAFVNAGLSGESAAGAVGWANSEGSYDIIGRAQGHYGGGINDSISKGAVPTTGGTSNTLGGGGIFQFDPYTKYAPLNSPDWEDADKMVAFVIDSISKGDWNPAYDESGHNWSFQEFAKQTNIDETAMSWNAYERGNMAYVKPDQKKADARKFAEVFEASKYKYDDAKFQKAFGGGASSNNSSSSSQSSDDNDGDDDEEDSDNEDDDNDSSSSSSSSDSSNKASKKDSDKDKKTIDTDKAIKWYKDKLGKVKYSRDARTGPDSYDHSSALYYALVDGGAKESGSPVDTDSEHDWLKDNGYELVYEGAWSSKDDVQNREKGDVIIWGTKGSSSGDKGQTMLVEDKENIIQCSPSTDGIAENNYGQYRDRITMDYGKVYVYRPKESKDKKDKDDDKEEVDADTCGDSDNSNLSTDTGQPLDVPYTITQLFGASANAGGPNAGSGHTGMDLAAPEGSPIYAVTDGEVVEVNEEAMNIDGNHVMHTLPDGTIIYYGHMRDVPLVKKGDKVKKGQLIGYVGQTGVATGPHIHFERRKTKVFQYGDFLSPASIILGDTQPQVGMVIDPKTQKGGAPSKE